MPNLLFDLDGTLADPIKAFAGSIEYAFDALKLERPPLEAIRKMIGPPLQTSLPEYLGPARAGLAPELLKQYRIHHGETGIYDYRLYPGMEETLRALRPRHRIFVATSKPTVYSKLIFEHFGKTELFEEIHGSELSGENSRKGDLIRHILSTHGLAAQDTIMIGDRKHDAIGAHENGVTSFGVAWGYGSEEELHAAGVHWLCRSWDELGKRLLQ